MKTEKDNYKLYRSTFDKVHASDELIEKVKNMTITEAKKKTYVLKRVLCIAAVIVTLFMVSNLVVYAAKGESLVEILTTRVTVNGEEMDIKVKKTTDENGNVKYTLPIVIEDNNTVDEDGTTYEYSNEFEVEIENPEDIDRIEFETEEPDSNGIYIRNEIVE